MLITFLVLKMTLDILLAECNKQALVQDRRERMIRLKSQLLQLRTDYEHGAIDGTSYSEHESEILGELNKLAKEFINSEEATRYV